MKVHSLKTDPDPFEAILNGTKRFEFRKNDRDFRPGDVLHLREKDRAEPWNFSGRSVVVLVTYVMTGSDVHKYGVPKGYILMSIVTEDEDMQALDKRDARRSFPRGSGA